MNDRWEQKYGGSYEIGRRIADNFRRQIEGHPRVYAMLKGYGHSPAKALEIVIDARRGDPTALQWVRHIRKLSRAT